MKIFPRAAAAAVLFALVGPAASQTWTDLSPATGPAPEVRTNAGSAYDPVGNRMIVFGGSGAGGFLNDVWSFDLGAHTWTDLTPAAGPTPPVRRTPNCVYDSAGHRMLMWSGQGAAFLNDVWEFDLTTHSWSEFTPPDPEPNIRYGVASIFDPMAGDLVAFAGFTFDGRFHDTWRFDPGASAWTDVTPAGTSPLERCLHAGAYDPARRWFVMYGGQNNGPLGDLWAFDLVADTWTELTPAVSPQGRWFAATAWATVSDRLLVFGGNRGVPGKTNEVLAYSPNGGDWSTVSAAGVPPSARDGSTGIYDPSQDRFVVFGGSDAGRRNDVWSLNDVSTGAPEVAAGPEGVALTLRAARPNPFRSGTRLELDLRRPARATLSIHDVQGRVVRRLDLGALPAGSRVVEWDGRDETGAPAASGVYWARLAASGEQAVRRLILRR